MSDPVAERLAEIRRVTTEAMQGMVIDSNDFVWVLATMRQQAADIYGCLVEEVETEMRDHVLYFRFPPRISVSFTVSP